MEPEKCSLKVKAFSITYFEVKTVILFKPEIEDLFCKRPDNQIGFAGHMVSVATI